MQNIRIKNAENGGFIITEDHELYGTPLAALSNSGDLLRWMTEQFIKPKKEVYDCVDLIKAHLEPTPEPEQDGFITKEPEWISWSGGENPCPEKTDVEVQFRFGAMTTASAFFLDWSHSGGKEDIVRYRVLS